MKLPNKCWSILLPITFEIKDQTQYLQLIIAR